LACKKTKPIQSQFFDKLHSARAHGREQDRFITEPQETYLGCKTGWAVGIYDDVRDFIYDYIRSQENANRTDVRWMRVSNDDGRGLLIKGEDLLMTSLWTYSIGYLESAEHTYNFKTSNPKPSRSGELSRKFKNRIDS
jgi:hypothetical protein